VHGARHTATMHARLHAAAPCAQSASMASLAHGGCRHGARHTAVTLHAGYTCQQLLACTVAVGTCQRLLACQLLLARLAVVHTQQRCMHTVNFKCMHHPSSACMHAPNPNTSLHSTQLDTCTHTAAYITTQLHACTHHCTTSHYHAACSHACNCSHSPLGNVELMSQL
jgi:hypothetical protein